MARAPKSKEPQVTNELLHRQLHQRACIDASHINTIVQYWGNDLLNTILKRADLNIRIVESEVKTDA